MFSLASEITLIVWRGVANPSTVARSQTVDQCCPSLPLLYVLSLVFSLGFKGSFAEFGNNLVTD